MSRSTKYRLADDVIVLLKDLVYSIIRIYGALAVPELVVWSNGVRYQFWVITWQWGLIDSEILLEAIAQRCIDSYAETFRT